MQNSIVAKRSQNNPIIAPNTELLWQQQATFNPSVLADAGKFAFTYRALSAQQTIGQHALDLSTVGIAYGSSPDSVDQHSHRQLITPSELFDRFGCEDPRLTKVDDEYFIFYTALSGWPPNKSNIKVAVACTDDLTHIKEKHLVTPFNAKAMVLFPEKINGQYVALLTVNTDTPPAHIAIARFDHKEQMWSRDFWNNWYKNLDQHILNVPRFNTDHVEVGAVPVKTDSGWVLIYSHIQNYFAEDKRIFGIEALLLDHENPQRIVGRTSEPLLVPQESYELEGMIKNVIFPSGAVMHEDEFYIYYGAADTTSAVASCKTGLLLSLLEHTDDQVEVQKFYKHPHNPIISPKEERVWQAQAVFNSAAVVVDDVFYLLYRAMSWDNTSTIGCATSTDGLHFSDNLMDPIYVPRMEFEQKTAPNGFSGCEDPRITKFGDRYYMFYTAYNGKNPPQVALTSIAHDDFTARRWLWDTPILISDPGIDNKNACLFSEKVDDKFVILHRTAGRDIAIDFVSSLTDLQDQGGWLEKEAAFKPRDGWWDSAKIGIAGPPLLTEAGWLLIYHGVSESDKNYRLGYMILDREDPFNVLYRTKYPILEPQYQFEKEGIVPNVVFSCGAVEKDGTVYLYYGGADRVMCVATYELEKLLAAV